MSVDASTPLAGAPHAAHKMDCWYHYDSSPDTESPTPCYPRRQQTQGPDPVSAVSFSASYTREFAEIASCVQAFDKYKILQGTKIGAFATDFELPLLRPPLIGVKGVGELAFPITASQCRELIAVATQAPYGKGEQTIVDTSVRNTFQINADAITLDEEFLTAIRTIALPKVCEDIGLVLATDPDSSAAVRRLDCRLYKLLIYEKGGFFLPHRDSEKTSGMFGTMVVVLPCRYSGGELVVEHGRETHVIDSSAHNGWRRFSCAAFYASCMHEIKPVTSGYRVALTFNLCRIAKAPVPSSPSRAPPIVERLAHAFRAWCALPPPSPRSERYEPQGPQPHHRKHECCLIPFDHMYTRASLVDESIKGSDRALLVLIRNAVDALTTSSATTGALSGDAELPLVLPFLCVFEVERAYSVDCEYDEDCPRFKVTEVVPMSRSGQLVARMLVLDCVAERVDYVDVVSVDVIYTDPSFSWWKETPSKKVKEHTGNEGTNIDLSYRKAGILLVPSDQRWQIVTKELTHDAGVNALKKVAAASLSDASFDECMQLVRQMTTHKRTLTQLPEYLSVLCQLRERVTPSSSSSSLSSSSSSSSSFHERLYGDLTSALSDALVTCPLDLSSPSLPTDLDALVPFFNMSVLEQRLQSTFAHELLGDRFAPGEVLPSYSSQPKGDRFEPGLASTILHRFLSMLTARTLPQRWQRVALSVCLSFFRRLLKQQQQQQQQTDKLALDSMTLESLLAIASPVVLLLVEYYLEFDDDAEVHADVEGGNAPRAQQRPSTLCVAAAAAFSFAFARIVDKTWASAARATASSLCIKSANEALKLETNVLPHLLSAIDRVLAYDAMERQPILNAFAPLVRSLKMWLEQQIAVTLPDASSWAYPTHATHVFGTISGSEGPQECKCDDCRRILAFLASESTETLALRVAQRRRSHAKSNLDALGNPYLKCNTIEQGSPYTLMVKKTTRLRSVLEPRVARLRTMLDKCDELIGDVTVKKEEEAGATATSTVKQEVVAATVKREREDESVSSQPSTKKAKAVKKETQ